MTDRKRKVEFEIQACVHTYGPECPWPNFQLSFCVTGRLFSISLNASWLAAFCSSEEYVVDALVFPKFQVTLMEQLRASFQEIFSVM